MSIMQFFRKIIPGVNQFQPRLSDVVEIDHERALAEQELEQSRKTFDETLDLLLADMPKRRRAAPNGRGH